MVHLHVRSHFSFLDGASPPKAFAERAARMEQTALALTDWFTLAGAVRHAVACERVGIKPIFGAAISLDRCPLILICLHKGGYANLCDLLTQAHQRRLDPVLNFADLQQYAEGLLCILADARKTFDSIGDMNDALYTNELLAPLSELFKDRLYVELAHHCRPSDSALDSATYRARR